MLDPLTTTSEGTLVITCKPRAVGGLSEALAQEKIESYAIGRVGRRSEGRGLLVSSGGSKPKPHAPEMDGYWKAYSDAVSQGLK